MTEHLTKDAFLSKVFNYEENKEWKYEGDKPAIIDFYADWCGPCKMVAPVLEELSEEYADKMTIYKVDTDAEQELASVFGIQSIPSMLFIPVDDKPQMAVGALPKDSIKQAMKGRPCRRVDSADHFAQSRRDHLRMVSFFFPGVPVSVRREWPSGRTDDSFLSPQGSYSTIYV
jgi:thioredoxin 1